MAAMVHSTSLQADVGNRCHDTVRYSLQQAAHAPGQRPAVAQEQATKDFARSRLHAAIASQHCAVLAEAISRGRNAGVEADLLQKAEALLQQLQEGHLWKQQCKEEAEQKLRSAIASGDAAALRSALEAGSDAKAEVDLLNEAHMALAQVEVRRRTAVQGVEFAVQARDVQLLEDALRTARAEGIDEPKLLQEAERLLLEEQAKAKLEGVILAAMQSGDEQQLQAAIAEAKRAGLTSKTVARAEELLAKQQAKVAASDRLQALLDSGHPDAEDLRAAIQEARRAECDVALLNDAYLRLATLEMEIASAAADGGSGQAAEQESQGAGECSDRQGLFLAWSSTEQPGCAETRQGEAETEDVDGDGEEVLVRQWQKCPSCTHLFATVEAVREHWLQEHSGRPAVVQECSTSSDPRPLQHQGEASTLKTDSGAPSSPSVASTSVKKKKCPTCGDLFNTAEEAREHWLQKHQEKQLAEDAKPEDQGATTVACDEAGKPVVVRKVDSETGAAHTTVLREDGVEKKFGEKTVLSMAAKQEAEVQLWLQNMTDMEIRGLCHEVTQRVVEGSQRYHTKRARLQQLSCRYNLLYFGLPADATEKDLDAKYRRLAKSLHPDKHGGSEEAKERFQTMKARYEAVKKTFTAADTAGATPSQQEDEKDQQEASQRQDQEETQRKASESGSKGRPEEGGESASADQESNEGRQASAEPTRREAYEEDDDDGAAPSAQEEGVKCDFNSRKSTLETLWNMVRQIKNIQTQEADLDAQLQQYERAMPKSSST